MARIRSIKPEFPQSETMGRVSRESRLLFLQLFTVADDEGRLRGNSRMLASLLYPYDDDSRDLIEGWLGELESVGAIRRYVVEGDSYIDIPNWLKHQKIDHPSKSKFPAYSEEFANIREDSRKLAWDQGRDRIGREGTGSVLAETAKPKKAKPAIPDWFAQFRDLYPERAGDQGWQRALKAANARMAEGHTPDEFIEGAMRYRAFCEATGKLGTEYVKQAASFLGPDKSFALPWLLPKTKAETQQDANVLAVQQWLAQ
jgi:hypothetical protein